ncbi:hypothetical protein L0152_18285, partial [bacterium]|nr:hypothetical protein [bacterium]
MDRKSETATRINGSITDGPVLYAGIQSSSLAGPYACFLPAAVRIIQNTKLISEIIECSKKLLRSD